MYSSLEELCYDAEEKKCAFWELVLLDDMQQRGVSRKESFEATKKLYLTMKKADEDYEKASQLISNTSLYKQSGNSIVVDVLEAIFRKWFK